MATGTWGGLLDMKVFEVKVSFRLGLSLCQFGWGMRGNQADSDVEGAILPAARDFIQTNLRPLLTPADKLVSIDVLNVVTKTGVSHDYGNLGGTSDAQGTSTEPSMLAAVVTMKSGVRQRLGTGRFFFPVRHEGYVDGDVLSAGGTQAIQGFVTAFANEFIGVNPLMGAKLANFHGPYPERPRTGRNATGRPPLPAVEARWYDVESLRLNTVLTAIKSRKAGVGS